MILVDIYVPTLDKIYDFQIDETVQISKVVTEIAEMLGSQTKTDTAMQMDQAMLCCAATRTIFQKTRTLRSYGIKNGASLILV